MLRNIKGNYKKHNMSFMDTFKNCNYWQTVLIKEEEHTSGQVVLGNLQLCAQTHHTTNVD